MMFLFNSVFFRFLLISLGPGCKNIHNYDKLGAALAFLQSPQGSKSHQSDTNAKGLHSTILNSIGWNWNGRELSWSNVTLLKLTYWWPLKNCGWETTFFLARAIFRAVSVVGSVKRFLLKLKGQGDISIIAFLFWVVMGLMLGRTIFENSTLQLNNS